MNKHDAKRTTELLAPARDYDSGRAAIDSGADAVYIGGPAFGARVSAGNPIADIERLAKYARRYGARVYAALNTIIYENELPEAEKTAKELISAGADALIVQDMAFMRMGLSGVEMHASTQMCNRTPEQVLFLRECGFSRVILERGLTMDEIRKAGKVEGMELECFVHGAICVGFSGQCYMSRSVGKRSGNRGDCSQPCRLTYDLTDGNGNTVAGGRHLLSVRDLNLSGQIPQLLDAGITSFKIEGRLKDTNYVRNIVAYYRQAIDSALETRPSTARSSSGRSEYDFEPDPARSFSRGFTTWMLDGKTGGQSSFSTPKATGEYIGKVKSAGRESFVHDGTTGIHAGDGICFISGGTLSGTNVNRADGTTIYPNDMNGISPGTAIFRNYDHVFNTRLEKSRTRRVIDVDINASVSPGGITVTLTDMDGNSVSHSETITAEPAKDAARMTEAIRIQLSKLGGSMFFARSVNIGLTNGDMPFIPVSKLNDIRRKITEKLVSERLRNFRRPETRQENISYPCPVTELGGEANVTNSLAARFYRDHGVQTIAEPFDTLRTLSGQRVMTSAYCLRRELGQCLKESPTLRGPLRLKRGTATWLLEFDCAACRMNIIKD